MDPGGFIDVVVHLRNKQDTYYRSMYWAVHELEQVGLVKMYVDKTKDIVPNLKDKSNWQNDTYENEEIDLVKTIEGSPTEQSILIDNIGIGLDDPLPFDSMPVDMKSFACEVTEKGRRLAKNLLPLWKGICDIELDEDQENLLHYVNQHSPKSAPDHQWLEGAFFTNPEEPDIPDYAAMRTLERLKFVSPYYRDYYDRFFQLHSTYKGLVWDTRRELIFKSKLINDLVAEWETTSVDFKRELHLDTKDEKAEFIKDILSLVNTQASGRRWLIIGFDKNHAYFAPPDPKLTQDRIEQIIARYITPCVDIHYAAVNYQLGPVGMLEVIRDPKKLPYCVMKEINRDRKSPLQSGEIFVRHGSQVEKPTDAELDALQKEGNYARSN